MHGRRSSNDGSRGHRVADVDGPGHAESVDRSRDSGDERAASALDLPLATAALVPEPAKDEAGDAGDHDHRDDGDLCAERDVDECVRVSVCPRGALFGGGLALGCVFVGLAGDREVVSERVRGIG